MLRGDQKITELETSIRDKIERFQEFAVMGATDRSRLLARTTHKNIDRVM